MPQRRSRMCRTRTGKSIALTSRDIEIFRVLARYRYLRSTYLHAFTGGASKTRFKERLGDLFHEGYIDRPAKQWEFADARSMPAVYESGERGERIVRERGGDEGARTFLTSGGHRQFMHSVMICECLASFELAAREREGIRFIPWLEILARAPEATRTSPMPFRIPVSSGGIVPDGLFGLEYRHEGRKAYRFFALEADRGTMPITRSDNRQTSYLGKLDAYREAIARQAHRSHLGIPNLFVLTITTDPQRLSEIMRRFADHGASPTFLFKAMEPAALNIPKSGLLFEPWERAGLPPLHIGESG